MPAPLCTPTDVADSLGVELYSGRELVQVTRLCAQVSGLIRGQRKLIDTWIATGQVDPDVVVGVACQVVVRVKASLAAGGGVVRSEQHPEHSYELTSAAAAGLSLSATELASLTPATVARQQPFSVMPT